MKRWEELPIEMQREEVRPYYELLRKKKGELIAKRIFDIIVSSILLILFSPILLALALWIKLDSEGPVFYRQVRVTTYGKQFRIFKFRTMVQNADQMGSLVTQEHDPRISRAGAKLRNWRLDELPQLINVLLGDMTFVGTRPEVPKYVKDYLPEMWATLLLPAGVTSYASMMYKDEATELTKYTQEGYSVDEAYMQFILPQKMKYNYEYMHRVSVIYDMGLMLKTVWAVLQ